MPVQSIIFGVDIVKGSSRSRESPRYAVVILNGDMLKFPSVSRFKLLRMIKQYRPAILAVDSITELAENRKDLVNFLKRLPPEVKLVQVTGNERQIPLTKLGHDAGISFNPLIPEEEAFVCAYLASIGVGYVVSVFEDRTVIKVSRGRSPGRGGWSQNRYRRKVQGMVREKVRDIESKLKGKEFELSVTEGFGGLVNGTFVVNAKRSELGIHNSREEDVQVTVTSVEKDTIEFIPLERKRREYIIVGIDPGTTIGVSILDLNGKLIDVVSSRVMSVPDIIEYIRDRGRPVVVATDVVPPPNTVEKIKRAFNAVLFVPNERIPVDEKIRLASPYGYSNSHERDALSAAAKAFKTYKNKFARIEKKTPSHMNSDDVKALALEGKSIDVALNILKPAPTVPNNTPGIHEPVEVTPADEKIAELREQLSKKDEQLANLRSYVNDLKGDISRLENRMVSQEKVISSLKNKGIDDARRSKEVTIRDQEIARLKKELTDTKKRNSDLRSNIDRLKQIRVLEFRGDKSPVKIIENLSKDAIIACDKRLGLKPGDIIFVRDAGGGVQAASLLIERGIKAVIKGTDMSHLAEEKFTEAKLPVISREEVSLKIVDDFAVLDPKRLESAMEKWGEMLKEREKKKSEEWFHGIVNEYKVQRKKEFRKAGQV
ncbi:DUF460 domain-containing protein [Methanocella sp. CWC-04]|uniref:DUF460 domain-containing protein n=1 Tax=Methanooceanicella nereidis TaxID=2052831 RepID=A0AAP2W5V7_9EURY|nr:DUF460 domain-containing protein [Methanocella sp. CWC-04]MCD1294552.1 DUF460 domain-containing protein [Methanocella sp. CWC-04]